MTQAALFPMKRTYSPSFEAFWAAYPKTPNMSKAETFKSWGRVKPPGNIVQAVTAYCTWLRGEEVKRGRFVPVVHATTFLNQRRWEGFVSETVEPSSTPPLCSLPSGLQEALKKKLGSRFDAWFGTAELISLDPLVMSFPSLFRRNYVEERFGDWMRGLNQGRRVEFVVRKENPSSTGVTGGAN